MSKYHLFWNGIFSQWYPSDFEYDGTIFSSAEQFMMFYKAIFFKDHEIAAKILKETHPKVQKKLGRQVKNFDIEAWARVAKSIVYVGSEEKYTQNPKLCKELTATYPLTLVEASPHDKIWGIGLGENDPDALDETKWKGTNWLGVVLTHLRDNIMSGNSSDSSSNTIMGTILSKRYEMIKLIKGI